jgi:lysophospholipase L1-like esterase
MHVNLSTVALLWMSVNAASAGDGPVLIRDLNAGKPQTIVTYGTSLTAGGAWVGQLTTVLDKRYPKLVTIINSGQGATWSDWGVKNLEQRVLKHKPDAVFIEFAINDAYLPYRTSVALCRRNLEAMIDRILEQSPKCEIFLMTMNPPIKVHLARRPHFEEYYQVYRDVAKERKLRLIDLYVAWKAVLDKDKALFDRYVPDGIHPAAEGCEKVITPGILAALFGKE